MNRLLIAFAVFCSYSTFAHKYYVSIADMEWDEQEKSINVSLKATDHDFVHLLEMTFQERIDLEKVTDTSRYYRFI